jgi:hypothetical protein
MEAYRLALSYLLNGYEAMTEIMREDRRSAGGSLFRDYNTNVTVI